MTLHAAIQYVKYRWRAQGRHGTHSPFVYGFVEQVLRKRNGTLSERICQYTGIEQALSEKDIAFAGPQSLVLVPYPHATAKSTRRWKAICASPGVTLSIDLYHTGLLLFRKEFKARQHFILR